MKTKELDVSSFYDGVPSKIVIKRLTFGEICEIKDNTPMAIDPLTKLPKEKEGETALMFLQASIVSAPFVKGGKPTIEEIKTIDYSLGTFLIEKVFEYNNVNPK